MRRLIRRLLLGGVLASGCGLAIQAAAPAQAQGVITGRAYLDINGTAVTDLTGNAKFPNSPDVVRYEPYFEWNSTGDIATPANNGYADNYGAQMIGYFYPPTSGDYVFYLSADDNAALYLSTDDTPANKKLIAQESVWSNPREWTTSGGSSDLTMKDSQTFAATEWATKDTINGGAKITLQAGKAYYIEALLKEGGGGDNLAVAVQDPNFAVDSTLPIPGQYLSSFDKNTGPTKIVTQPQSQSVNEGNSASFSVVSDGTPPFTYQWKKNGTDISGATGTSYSIGRTTAADNGAKFSVVVTGAQGTVTSADASLTVASDTTPPTISAATGSVSFDSVTVTFSEPVGQASAETASNYKLSGGVTVSSAKLGAAPGTNGDNKVVLTTSKQALGSTLTLTVSNVKDAAGNTIAANSTMDFKTFVFVKGVVLQKFFENVTGGIAGLTNDTRFPNNPSFVTTEPSWEYPPNGGNEGGSNYGNELVGYFTPAVTGDYIFFTCSDDPSLLFLSTDDNPANKKLIAQETAYSNPRQWVNSGGSSDLDAKRSDFFLDSEWINFGPAFTIPLTAGKQYYMESLHTEGGGGDNVGATFIFSGDADPADGTAPALTGDLIGTYLDPNGASVTYAKAPQNTTVTENRSASFSISATGTSAYGTTVTYQWQKAPKGSTTFTDIAGATKTTYTSPRLALSDDGVQYRVMATVPTLSVPSDAATVTVVPDTFPPAVVSVGAMKHGNDWEVGVIFDEKIGSGATTMANYKLDVGNITAVRAVSNSSGTASIEDGVVLTATGLTAGGNFSVTVNNLADLKGNKMTGAVTKQGTASKMTWTAISVEGQPEQFATDAIAVAPNGFNLISGGQAFWDVNDDITFVYEEITGDFDKVAQVEYQDPSSTWARAGLTARESLLGVDYNPLDASRYQNVQADPDIQWDGAVANNSFETNRRVNMGGATDSANAGGNPLYPDAWVRLKREGQVFSMFYSNDKITWNSLGTSDFAALSTDFDPLPAKLYVGPVFGPENGNITDATKQGAWAMRIRNYGDYSAAQPAATLTISRSGNNITISWDPAGGTLQSAATVLGPWTDVGSGNPATVSILPSQNQFFRVTSP